MKKTLNPYPYEPLIQTLIMNQEQILRDSCKSVSERFLVKPHKAVRWSGPLRITLACSHFSKKLCQSSNTQAKHKHKSQHFRYILCRKSKLLPPSFTVMLAVTFSFPSCCLANIRNRSDGRYQSLLTAKTKLWLQSGLIGQEPVP